MWVWCGDKKKKCHVVCPGLAWLFSHFSSKSKETCMKRGSCVDWKLNLTLAKMETSTRARTAGISSSPNLLSISISDMFSVLFFINRLWLNKKKKLLRGEILTKRTYFPWGNWDEREALLRCTWWWAGGSRPCPSCTALSRPCSETWPCRSPAGRTPWWPTQATGAHGPGTTTTGLQEDRRRRRRERKFHNNCFWTETRRNVGRASYLTLVKAVWETNKLETGFSISSRRCSESGKYSWSYFNHMERVCLSGMIIRFQVNNLPQNIIHSFIKSNFGVHTAIIHMARKKAKTNSICKNYSSAVWYAAHPTHPLWKTNLKLTNRRFRAASIWSSGRSSSLWLSGLNVTT